MKKCSICGCEKDIEEFRIRDKKTGLRRKECKACLLEKQREWKRKNPEKPRQYYDSQYEKTRIRLCPVCGERYRRGGSCKFCSVKCQIIGCSEKKENGCWEWSGTLNKQGYGKTSIDNKDIGAHRASYIAYNGEIPDGMIIRHECDNRKCVNPEHLQIGTWAENSQDMVQRGRSLRGAKYFKNYTWKHAEKSYTLRQMGLTYKEIAIVLKMTPCAARNAMQKYKDIFIEELKNA